METAQPAANQSAPQRDPSPDHSPAPQPTPPLPSAPSPRDRRIHPRESVEAAAAIFTVKSGLRLNGRILNLSSGGCGIWLIERFSLGIYTRVEVEFCVQGLPFRLAGVIQSIHDRHSIGIRFLDMSERKKAQVAELMAEIQAMNRAKQDAEEAAEQAAEQAPAPAPQP